MMCARRPLPKTVLIVGGGPSGMVTLRNLIERGQFDHVQLVERRDNIGGIWHLDLPGEISVGKKPRWPSPAYPGLIGNILPEYLSFSGFPFPVPSSAPAHPFPSLVETHAYLCKFAEAFLAEKKIRLNTEVVRVEERVGGKGWKVVLRKWNEEGEACDIQEVWDAVVIASGCYDFPMWPDTPGLTEGRDKGLIKHAKWWTGPEDYEGKRVVVVGNGNSANDIAAQLVNVPGVLVSRSTRHGSYQNFPLYPDPRIVDVAGVDRYNLTNSESGHQTLTLHLHDGSELTDVDAVWVGTGYGWSVPFVFVLSNEVAGSQGENRLVPLTSPSLRLSRIPSLHRFVLYAPNPTLGFVGQVMTFTPFILADVSSTWLALAWSGAIPYPMSVEERLAGEKEKLARVEETRLKIGSANQTPSSFVHYHVLNDTELEYARGLRRDIINARSDLDVVLPVWSNENWRRRERMFEAKANSLRLLFEERLRTNKAQPTLSKL